VQGVLTDDPFYKSAFERVFQVFRSDHHDAGKLFYRGIFLEVITSDGRVLCMSKMREDEDTIY
jgi:hypothetical protein